MDSMTHIFYVIVFMHTLDGLIWMRISYVIPFMRILDASGMCHYVDQILDGFIWMHVLCVIIFTHISDGFVCIRISYVIIFIHIIGGLI